MHSLHLACDPEQAEFLSAELWEAGTVGIQELDEPDRILLIAAFEDTGRRSDLLKQFAAYSSEWKEEDSTDWVEHTKNAWPVREVGERLLLAPLWANSAPTPAGRFRVVHNPGLASGTGEHPCTLLALLALDRLLLNGLRLVDVGTGSGLLAMAALRLGARQAFGLDPDQDALQVAGENFRLNALSPLLVAGSCDALASGCAEITIANINGTVLLSIFDDLLRVTVLQGRLILTGFTESELPFFLRLLPGAEVSAMNEWRCIVWAKSSN